VRCCDVVRPSSTCSTTLIWSRPNSMPDYLYTDPALNKTVPIYNFVFFFFFYINRC
jgi:hypothetical protein